MLQDINTQGLIFLHSFITTPKEAQVFGFIADFPIFFLPVFLFVSWIYFSYSKQKEQKNTLLFIFYSTLVAFIINMVIQSFVTFDRPESVLEATNTLILNHIPDASFPSDHTAISIAFVTALYLGGFKKVAFMFLPFAMLMNISRIISGVHWPLDVFAGTIVGILSGGIVFHYLRYNKYILSLNKTLLKIAHIIKL
ncbi:MAG: phosphatase PAP2 family protein [Candidatus Gracilibacteria bacterium]|nr:phosphatase PAP2 family protein [Candidatus Gracilibacteria bacterium]